jgi:hypothetical protein
MSGCKCYGRGVDRGADTVSDFLNELDECLTPYSGRCLRPPSPDPYLTLVQTLFRPLLVAGRGRWRVLSILSKVLLTSDTSPQPFLYAPSLCVLYESRIQVSYLDIEFVQPLDGLYPLAQR